MSGIDYSAVRRCECGCGQFLKKLRGRGTHRRYSPGHWKCREGASEKRRAVPRVCEWCGRDFLATKDNVARGWGRFCSRRCKSSFVAVTIRWAGVVASSHTIRQLRSGERIPAGTPKRYVEGRGYIRLRWLVGTQTYVETYEHRIIAGRVHAEMSVHHINGKKWDNRPENLAVMSPSDHGKEHARMRRESKPGSQREDI